MSCSRNASIVADLEISQLSPSEGERGGWVIQAMFRRKYRTMRMIASSRGFRSRRGTAIEGSPTRTAVRRTFACSYCIMDRL